MSNYFFPFTKKINDNIHEAVVAPGHNQRAITIEVHAGDRVRVGRQRLQTLALAHVPYPHRLVKRPGHDEVRLRVEVDAEHVVRVAAQHLDGLPLQLSQARA